MHAFALFPEKLLPIMDVGRGEGGGLAPWNLKLLAKKGCFFNFEGYKPNFTTFGPPWKKFSENPLLAPPWKKSFRRPCCQCKVVSFKSSF